MKEIENFNGIEVKYLGATNTRGSRVKMTSPRLNESKTIPYDYKYNSAVEVASTWLHNQGHTVVGQCETKDGHMLLVRASGGMFKRMNE